jgi:sulfate adenylyltransferase subunit 1
MVTGASTANLALILVDARKGVVEQTYRHTFIASLLGIPHVVFCINKMDLVDYSEDVFTDIKDRIENFSSKLDVKDIRFIPISALKGDNVVNESEHMPWYKGGTLLYMLENIHIGSDHNHIDCRFPVQYVIRPQSDKYHDFRGYAGRIAGGVFKPGDEIVALPSGFTSRIKEINTADGPQDEAFAPQSVTLLLEDDIDISRGDMIVRSNNRPTVSQDVDLMICWMTERPLLTNGKYAVKHTTNDARCLIKNVQYKVDINTLHRIEDDKSIGMNDIARITIRTTKPLLFDRYQRNRITGSMVLIDEGTNETVGAGMIV